jgi:hypothetical protein
MNSFPVGLPLSVTVFIVFVTYYLLQSGTRVFYWGANGEINYGTVQSTSRMADVSVCSELSAFHLLTMIAQGTQILAIREDSIPKR